jgi:DNA-binding NarL/FixJ family response regulator
VAGKITIVLIEQAYLLKAGMENLLKELPGIKLAEVFDGSEKRLAAKVNALKPDFIIIDPKALGETLHSFVQMLNNKSILIGLVDEHTHPATSSKFNYTIDIRNSKYELLETFNKIPGVRPEKADKSDENQPLSSREITILKHITLGMTNQEIAEKLFISVHTVTTHRKNITKKLGIKTVSGLTVYALLNKIIEMDDLQQ